MWPRQSDGRFLSYTGRNVLEIGFPAGVSAAQRAVTKNLLRTAYAENDEPVTVIKIWNINGPILVLGSELNNMCQVWKRSCGTVNS